MKRILSSFAVLALSTSVAFAGGIGGGFGGSTAGGQVNGGSTGASALNGYTSVTTTATQQSNAHNDTTGYGVGGTALVLGGVGGGNGGIVGVGIVSGGVGGVVSNSDQDSGGQSVTQTGSLGFAGSVGGSNFGGGSNAGGIGGGIGWGGF